jgi:hypothetical protein
MDKAENDQFNRRFYKQTEIKFKDELKMCGLYLYNQKLQMIIEVKNITKNV